MAGRRIDDHSFWAGKGSAKSVLPGEKKVMSYSHGSGCGELSMYEDTDESIRHQQKMNVSKVKSHSQKAYYNN